MRLLVIAATSLLLAACGPEAEDPPRSYPEAAVVTAGTEIACPGAYSEIHWTDPDTLQPMHTCWWSCAMYKGVLYGSVGLVYEFQGFWRLRTENLSGGGC